MRFQRRGTATASFLTKSEQGSETTVRSWSARLCGLSIFVALSGRVSNEQVSDMQCQ